MGHCDGSTPGGCTWNEPGRLTGGTDAPGTCVFAANTNPSYTLKSAVQEQMPEAKLSLLQRVSAPLRKLLSVERRDAQGTASHKEQALQLAAATLLFEMTRVDHEIREADLRAVADALKDLFALSSERIKALVSHVSEPSRHPTSYFPYVRLINKSFTPDQKRRLIEHMWIVALADREIHMFEDHLVRKISDLLYVPHREFIAAKQHAKALDGG